MNRRSLFYAAPLVLAGVAGASFFAMLKRMKSGDFDPHDIGSPTVGKPIPDFKLGGVAGNGFSSTDVVKFGKPLLVNFFASWCIPCVAEAQLLAGVAQQVPVWGIAYKDKPADTQQFLSRYGNPYTRLAADNEGYTAINFGLYGVPETYVIDTHGVIRARYAGALTDEIIGGKLLPLVQSLS